MDRRLDASRNRKVLTLLLLLTIYSILLILSNVRLLKDTSVAFKENYVAGQKPLINQMQSILRATKVQNAHLSSTTRTDKAGQQKSSRVDGNKSNITLLHKSTTKGSDLTVDSSSSRNNDTGRKVFYNRTTDGIDVVYTSNPEFVLRILNETAVAVKKPVANRHHRIPRRFIFIHTKYTALKQLPQHFYDNVMNTVRMYREAWNSTTIAASDDEGEAPAPIWFLGYDDCVRVINATEPRLVTSFINEKVGAIKADICRLAALYQKGGYYFDVDLRVLKALRVNRTVEFVTPHEFGHNGLQAGFIATAPRHPIIRKDLNLMVQYYHHGNLWGRKDRVRNTHMATGLLKVAFESVPEGERGNTYMSLDEIHLDAYNRTYPEIPRQHGDGCCCNFAIVDKSDSVVYFFARIVGAGPNCEFPNKRRRNKIDASSRLRR